MCYFFVDATRYMHKRNLALGSYAAKTNFKNFKSDTFPWKANATKQCNSVAWLLCKSLGEKKKILARRNKQVGNECSEHHVRAN